MNGWTGGEVDGGMFGWMDGDLHIILLLFARHAVITSAAGNFLCLTGPGRVSAAGDLCETRPRHELGAAATSIFMSPPPPQITVITCSVITGASHWLPGSDLAFSLARQSGMNFTKLPG